MRKITAVGLMRMKLLKKNIELKICFTILHFKISKEIQCNERLKGLRGNAKKLTKPRIQSAKPTEIW